jgi:lipid-A-disaccharide synthase-like uncharacterized protein
LLQEFINAFKEPWIIVGLVAQLLFSGRFLVQWIVSEKKGKSTVPVAFWYLSIAGGLMLLTYAIQRAEPIFVIGRSAGLVVYTRNLMLIYKERRGKGQSSE